MKRPLVVLTFAFCLGIFFASFIKIPLLFFYPVALVLVIFALALIKKGLIFDLCLIFLFFLLGAILLKNHDQFTRFHISRWGYLSDQYILQGIIDSPPQTNASQTTFLFKTKAIKFNQQSQRCCGSVLAHFQGRKELRYGDELLLRGHLYRPFKTKDSKKQSYREYLYNKGIYFIFSVKSDADLAMLARNKGFVPQKLALFLKEKISNIFQRYTRPVYASILEAMVLGEKKNIPAIVTSSMMKTGTVHILVVSGFNVGIVSAIVLMFLKIIRVRRLARFFLAIAFLCVYCLMTGASTPVVRSAVMAGIFMSAYFLRRQADIYNSLAAAGLFILGGNPRQIFDIGFQLSFTSVFAIVYLYPKIKTFCRLEGVKNRALSYLLDGLLVSFSAWLGTMGIIAHYFGIFSPVTVLANIFIVPLATLITLSGLGLIFISSIFPPLAVFFASGTELAVALLLKTNALLLKLPGAYFYLCVDKPFRLC